METLDDILRYNAVGMLLWLAVMMHRHFCDRLSGKLGALSALCSAGYLLASKPGLALFGIDIDWFMFPFAIMAPVPAWLFSLAMFDDDFQIDWRHWVVALAKLATGVGTYLAWKLGYVSILAPLGWTAGIVIIGILAHMVYVAWRGRNDDLVEFRRRFRSVFVTAVVIISVGVVIAETFLRDSGYNDHLLLLQASAFLAIALYFNWQLTDPDRVDLFFMPAKAEIPATSLGGNDDGFVADRYDLEEIMRLEATGVVLEQGLSIARMAEKAGMPEHRLRRLINQHLGYRNFADYLHHHRIEAAKDRLSDTALRHVPVLTIAMDLGYGSLGPFNRAFKERTGQTPTEYRRTALEV